MALTGCATAPVPVIPQIVHDTVKVYVPVPPEMTIACPIAQPSDRTIGTLVGIAYARKQALEQCNRQLDAIRGLATKGTVLNRRQ
jgi:hypothetical protein